MPTTPNNTLQNVQLYIKSELAWLDNEFWGIANANKSLEQFNNRNGNLGDTITFDTTPRYISYNGLVITQQPSVQRLQSLICSQAFNVSAGYTDQQFIFNVEDYMERFGAAAAQELGTAIESDILLNIVSGVIGSDPKSPAYGLPQVNSGPYRFYGNGVTPINSFTQLAQAWANFTAYGASGIKKRGVLPVDIIPQIVGTGLNQFAPDRANETAVDTWKIGRFGGLDVDWGVSNLLPIHVSGTIGDTASPNNLMTVVSTNDPTGVNVTSITFTEPTGGTDANAIKAGDLFEFQDVAGLPFLRFLTFIGHKITRQKVQFRAIADAATVAGTVTVQIQTINGFGLGWNQFNANYNLNSAIQAGMKVKPLPSHATGWMDAGNSFYLAMPHLPDNDPYKTVYHKDKESGASLRHYWGAQFGLDNRAYVRDTVFGSTLVAEDSMRLILPM